LGVEVGIGAEALHALLQDLELETVAEQLREEIANSKGQKRAKLIKRLRVIDNFIATGSKTEWMVLDVIPVIPPIYAQWCSWMGGALPPLT
jgi:DNA-directed RNA polymerase subunit beta'